jgi:hypothetical protein
VQAPSFIPAGAWLKPDGTVDITVGGSLLEGGQGVLLQDALKALKRYASQHGTLLMTTLHPDGQSSTDMVYGDGAIVQYDQGGAAPMPAHRIPTPTVAELEDVFGLPPLEGLPAAGGLRGGARRPDAFPSKPVFRPLGLTDPHQMQTTAFSPVHHVTRPATPHHQPPPQTGTHRGPVFPPEQHTGFPFRSGPVPAVVDLPDLFASPPAAPAPAVAPPARVHYRPGRRPLRAVIQVLVVILIMILFITFAPAGHKAVQDFIHPRPDYAVRVNEGPPEAPGAK